MLANDRPPKGKPTITDVARRAGVSKGLVSFVFNNRPGVAPSTRDRIIRAADELEWRPSARARTLSTRTSLALGLVIRRAPQVIAVDPFFPAFLAGVETVLGVEGRVLVLSVVADESSEESAYRALRAGNRVDGVFLTDLRRNEPRVRLIQELKIPAVMVGSPDVTVPFPTVNLDDSRGLAEAVRHLIGLGHRRIAHVAGDQDMLHGHRRRESYVRAMDEARLDPGHVIETDFSARQGAAATRTLLDSATRPTAIVYANDLMAIAGLGVLHERGIGVPHEMSVVGFDGADIAAHVFPALTTVASDPRLWGAAAANTLLRLIADGQAADVELPPAHLLQRSSTSHPPVPHVPPTPHPPTGDRLP